MNIHALDRPLRIGDQEQIAVTKALEAGWKPCWTCGVLLEPEGSESDWAEVQNPMCIPCRQERSCQTCNELLPRADWLKEHVCQWCRTVKEYWA